MKIIISHLTRMKPGYICVAGIEPQSKEHIRPVLGGSRLTVDLLSRHGGVFDIARLVDLGPTRTCGRCPEVEDRDFDTDHLVSVGSLRPDLFWKLLKSVSSETLTEIFGAEIKAQRNGCAVNEGTGNASLGCLQPVSAPELFINSWGKLRARVSDGSFDVDLSVTDLRFYQEDQQTVRSQVVADVKRRIAKGVGVILSVGLARAFQVQGDTERRHWLQINNVHLEDDPGWKCK